MVCQISNTAPIRKLYFSCQESILNKYNIEENKRTILNDKHYLVVAVDGSNYSSIEEGDKSNIVNTFSTSLIAPRLVRVGFTVNVIDNLVNLQRCLEFLSLSSLSTAYTTSFIPVTVLDYIKPEIEDNVFTTRHGILSVDSTKGYSGSDENEKPLYVDNYSITFKDIQRRLR